VTYVHPCQCGDLREKGDETGPSKNSHNRANPASFAYASAQFWCRRCEGVFSEPRSSAEENDG